MIAEVLKTGANTWVKIQTLKVTGTPKRIVGREKMQRSIDNLFNTSYQPLLALDCEMWLTKEPEPFERRECGKYRKLKLGELWAEKTFDCAWMHVTGQLPSSINPKDPDLCLLVDISGEGLIYSKEGEPLQGVTSYSSFGDIRGGVVGKRVVFINGLMDETGRIDFWIDAAANDLFGNYYGGELVKVLLRDLHVARCDIEKRALFYDCSVLVGVYDFCEDRAYAEEVYVAIEQALAAGDRSILTKYLETKNDDPNAFEYSAQGHSHLDLAWLWPIRETKRKGGRTFASQIYNLEAFPEAMFGASQAQLYQWIKDSYPSIYEKVKELHKQGRWDIQGACWVEPDSNLMGGESMLRQFYYGKQYFRKEFGVDPKTLWLVDSFGYSACWPQAMELSDVPYFLTQKLSWNMVNEFPYHTYHWQGLDGTPVLAHMLPENTYNAAARPEMLVNGVKRYKERKISNRSASLFGVGDGGGGPGFEHYERAQRMADIKGLPKYKQENIENLFDKLAEEDNGRYATHRGELYLEKHQGCYTTQSRTKKYNRQCEFLLRNYELLAAQATGELPISKEALDEIWKEVLLYQFHDILPGSSIPRVYDECNARYAVFVRQLREGIMALAEQIYGGGAAVNLNSFDYKGMMKHKGAWRNVEIPAFGSVSLEEAPVAEQFHAKAAKNVIENDCAKVVFHDGVIVSYFDKKHGKEIAKGPLNVFKLYLDMGNCWDFRPVGYYKLPHQTAKCTAFKTAASGARCCACVEYRVGEDIIQQEIFLTDGSPMLRFSTKIKHKGKRCMLRVGFHLPMGDDASFNLPFGHIKRKTTENNSIEKAQFEVSGQKFVDLSDGGYGVALLNDCKYGFRCKNGYLDINLIRSPHSGPGRNVDFGEHTLEYALYPHVGDLGADVYREAYFLNNPVLRTQGEDAKATQAFMSSSNDNMIIETVKIADDGNGILLRVYNCSDEPQSGEVRVAGYKALEYTNVMEEHRSVATEAIMLNGFEVKIIRYV